MRNNPDWQIRLVTSPEGAPAVRFLAPNRHALVELPVTVLRDALLMVMRQEAEAQAAGEETHRAGPT